MKIAIFAGTFAAALAIASPSYALNLSGSYLASFSVANGNNRSVCFTLTSTGAKQSYRDQGTVAAAQYPSYSGTYVVFKNGFHLAFVSAGKDSVVVTGNIANGTLVNTSATKFTTAGVIDNVGTLSATAACS